MIFKQLEQVLAGTKNQTRRVVKPGETLIGRPLYSTVLTPSGRVKWQVGRDYAVVPGRGKPAPWFHDDGVRINDPINYMSTDLFGSTYAGHEGLNARGFYQARIVITSIRQEPLMSISHQDAVAEGVDGVREYWELWESINGPGSWRDDPLVWVINFRVLPIVASAYQAWHRDTCSHETQRLDSVFKVIRCAECGVVLKVADKTPYREGSTLDQLASKLRRMTRDGE